MHNTRCSGHTNVVHFVYLNTSYLHLFILVPLRILDHGHVELEPEELTKSAPAEETNLKLTEGKHRCIPPIILGVSFNH
jgi:hypothetical protein